MEDYRARYAEWLEKCENPELREELLSVKGNDEEILDRFYTELKFGTAGLRGVLGAGTNRMNIYTINQASQGIADYLNATYENPTVAIAHDSRINSDIFAKETACVYAANGIKVYIYKELVPTPMLSFAVRRLKCSSGVIVTASHNPAEYNGYKCYDPEGYQMTDASAAEAYKYIEKVELFGGAKHMDFDEGLENGMIEYISDEVYEEFFDLVESKVLNPGACRDAGLKVIYTPLNGAGNKPVRKILKRIGIDNVTVVPSQENPDGHFPTCPYPNPEIRQAFEEAFKVAETNDADLLLATDPDCDRMGIAVKEGDGFRLMSGNEVGALFTEYVLSQYKARGIMPENPIVVESIVTTDLIGAIAADYGVSIKKTLTGFKYIGEIITKLEKKGLEDNFIIGMEESYGYLLGIHARDKDAVVASQLVCEMASYYKLQGKTLIDVMNELYEKYGSYINRVESFQFKGAAGMEKMKEIMSELRENQPENIAGEKIIKVIDYSTGVVTDCKTGEKTETGLPSSNVISFELPKNNSVVVRPSGTEPKIKVYITATANGFSEAEKMYNALLDTAKAWMEV